MKTFNVELKIVIGEYEKNTNHLVTAENEKDAGLFAMALESHGSASLDGHTWYDCHGEMAYNVRAVESVNNIDLKVLKKYFHIHEYDETLIKEMLED